MIEREKAFSVLAEEITDELVVTGIGSQASSWFQAKHRPENLYLRGPMGLAPSVGLGVALAHPERKVVVIEGDGSVVMALSSLVSVAHSKPGNLMIICMDNGIYEASGKSATVNAGRTDFVKTARGLGIGLARSVDNPGSLVQAVKELLGARECSFLHVIIAHREGPFKPFRFRPSEMKNQFLSACKEKNRWFPIIPIYPFTDRLKTPFEKRSHPAASRRVISCHPNRRWQRNTGSVRGPCERPSLT